MDKSVEAEGTIKKQGITSYQYGSHVLQVEGKTRYALTSKAVKLDDYVGKRVRLTGTKIPDYPLDGGPDFIEVSKVTVIE